MEDERGRTYSTHGEMSNVYRILVEKFEGFFILGRYRSTGKDNVKTVLNEIRCEDVDWIRLVPYMVY
jgi:hypothetical protein